MLICVLSGLCQRTGFPAKQLVQIYGTMFEMKCVGNDPDLKDRCEYITSTTYPVCKALRIPDNTDISNPSISLPDIAHPSSHTVLSAVRFYDQLSCSLTGQRLSRRENSSLT